MVPLAYGVFNLEAMDAHGGWLASAVDLVRFATAFDHPDKCPILKSQSIHEMFERPAGEPVTLTFGKESSRTIGMLLAGPFGPLARMTARPVGTRVRYLVHRRS